MLPAAGGILGIAVPAPQGEVGCARKAAAPHRACQPDSGCPAGLRHSRGSCRAQPGKGLQRRRCCATPLTSVCAQDTSPQVCLLADILLLCMGFRCLVPSCKSCAGVMCRAAALSGRLCWRGLLVQLTAHCENEHAAHKADAVLQGRRQSRSRTCRAGGWSCCLAPSW